MKNLAMAMVLTGGVFSLIGIWFLLREDSSSGGLAVLVPSLFLLTAGVITLSRQRS